MIPNIAPSNNWPAGTVPIMPDRFPRQLSGT